MKKYIFNVIIIMCMIMILCPSIVIASIMNYFIDEMNIEVQNIDDEVKNIQLITYDNNCNVVDAYENSELDFSEAEFPETYKNQYKDCAVFQDIVDPFTEEDYIFNNQYDKEKYYILQIFKYEYKIQNERFTYASNKKYKNIEELINANFSKDSEVKKSEIRNKKITCERKVYYEAKRIIQTIEIPISKLKDGKLEYKTSEIPQISINGYPSSFFGSYLRFEKSNGDFKNLSLGQAVYVYSWIGKQDDEIFIEKSIIIDYLTGKTKESFNRTILYHIYIYNKIIAYHSVIYMILSITLIVVIIKLVIARIMKIKDIKTIIIVSIFTQLLFRVLLIIGSYHILDNRENSFIEILLTILNVFVDFAIYNKKIKKQSSKTLLKYSFLSNLVSESIIFLIFYINNTLY